MTPKCENCELFLLMEQRRIKWFQDISSKNVSLLKTIRDQEEIILILKQKLMENRASVLTEQLEYVSKKALDRDELVYSGKNVALDEKMLEIRDFLSIFQTERDSFQRAIEKNEKQYSENISYLMGLNDYLREAIFDELYKSNKLKKYFLNKITGITNASESALAQILKEENERNHQEIKLRYRQTLQKSKDDAEKQSQLVMRLKKHNRDLYGMLHEKNVEMENRTKLQKDQLDDLKETIKRLKEKNNSLQKMIRLEVAGCQNDIQDARKRLLKVDKIT